MYSLGFVHRPEALEAVRAAGRLCQVLPFDADSLPPSYSLSQYRQRLLKQGQAGTCWLHAACCAVEVMTAALGYESFPICRRLVGYEGKKLEGGGNPTNGGDPTDALFAMTSDKGVGCAHESLWPYSDNSTALATRPPQKVYDDAKPHTVSGLVQVGSDDDAMRLIASGRPVANGIYWVYAWDNGQTFMDSVSGGTYGHALCEIGYAKPGVFDSYGWIQLSNWHDLLYPPLPAEKAAKVPGYHPDQPDRTSDFWVRTDVYKRVRDYGNAIRVGVTDAAGFGKVTTVPSFLDSFVV